MWVGGCRVLRSRPEGLAERKKPKKKREAGEGEFELPKKRRVSWGWWLGVFPRAAVEGERA